MFVVGYFFSWRACPKYKLVQQTQADPQAIISGKMFALYIFYDTPKCSCITAK